MLHISECNSQCVLLLQKQHAVFSYHQVLHSGYLPPRCRRTVRHERAILQRL